MGDTFSVDTPGLEQLRTLLSGPQAWLTSQRTGITGTAASAAAGTAGTAVAAFAAGLDQFLAAGATALGSDIRALDANRAGYERTDLGASVLFGGVR